MSLVACIVLVAISELHFTSVSKRVLCKTIQMKMSSSGWLICMKIKLIFIQKVLQKDLIGRYLGKGPTHVTYDGSFTIVDNGD